MAMTNKMTMIPKTMATRSESAQKSVNAGMLTPVSQFRFQLYFHFFYRFNEPAGIYLHDNNFTTRSSLPL
jgi:hypothetical protein